MNEIWKTIKGFEDYKVSNFGRVISFRVCKSGRVLKPGTNSRGYKIVVLTDSKGKLKSLKVHRLVAIQFLEKPTCGTRLLVNHKDEDKTNNNVSNLEWCNNSENVTHSWSRSVKRSDGKIYKSIVNAAIDNGVSAGHIHNAINNARNKTANGFTWTYND